MLVYGARVWLLVNGEIEMMKLDDIREAIDARIAVLAKLEQPDPVDLGDDEDNESDQDSLFAELRVLRRMAEQHIL